MPTVGFLHKGGFLNRIIPREISFFITMILCTTRSVTEDIYFSVFLDANPYATITAFVANWQHASLCITAALSLDCLNVTTKVQL